jgi:hypothetical protein
MNLSLGILAAASSNLISRIITWCLSITVVVYLCGIMERSSVVVRQFLSIYTVDDKKTR